MLPITYIPSRPTAPDCLAWSPDGELAAGAGEEIFILVPQHEGPSPWTDVRIRVNTFSPSEWSRQEQASFEDMSIGEEQAKATVNALAWSPSGLANHRRSVLAILTSNLILSLWASHSRATDPESWQRVLVVNHFLSKESRRVNRVRTMAWAPTNPEHFDSQTPFSKRKWGAHILAIANDNNGLSFFTVSSPFDGVSSRWDVHQIYQEDVQLPNRPNHRPSLLSVEMNAHPFIDHIRFRGWDSFNDLRLVYRSAGIQFHTVLLVSLGPPVQSTLRHEAGEQTLAPQHQIDVSHPKIPKPLEAQVRAQEEKYNLEHQLGGYVMRRTWGYAALGHLVAACISLHPSRSPEHVGAVQESSIILFAASIGETLENDAFPWQTPLEIDAAKAQNSILEAVLDRDLLITLRLSNLDFKIIYAAIAASSLLNDSHRQQRLQLAEDALRILGQTTNIDFQAERDALLSIRNRNSQETEQVTKARSRTMRATALLDVCPFCSEDNDQRAIPFEKFAVAYCPQNHSFSKACSSHILIIQLNHSHSTLLFDISANFRARLLQILLEMPTRIHQ